MNDTSFKAAVAKSKELSLKPIKQPLHAAQQQQQLNSSQLCGSSQTGAGSWRTLNKCRVTWSDAASCDLLRMNNTHQPPDFLVILVPYYLAESWSRSKSRI
jgi:hypothetical protein